LMVRLEKRCLKIWEEFSRSTGNLPD